MRAAPSREAAEAELRAIRRDGYLIRASRDVVGVTDIVAPILLRSGEAVATLAVSHLDRHDTAAAEREAIVQPLIRACRDLAEQLATGSAPA